MGYGTFFVLGRSALSHRVAWALTHGRTPPRTVHIRSTCDNPPCTNPRHLRAVSAAEANRETAARRKARGFNAVAVARALVDGATADDLVAIFGLSAETAAEYVRLGPEGVVERRAARGVRIPMPHRRRRLVANEAALADARNGAPVSTLVARHGVSRATAYRYRARAGQDPQPQHSSEPMGPPS